MQEKLNKFCDKIDLIKEKSDLLREHKKSTNKTKKLFFMISDIQHLCREISVDLDLYDKNV